MKAFEDLIGIAKLASEEIRVAAVRDWFHLYVQEHSVFAYVQTGGQYRQLEEECMQRALGKLAASKCELEGWRPKDDMTGVEEGRARLYTLSSNPKVAVKEVHSCDLPGCTSCGNPTE